MYSVELLTGASTNTTAIHVQACAIPPRERVDKQHFNYASPESVASIVL